MAPPPRSRSAASMYSADALDASIHCGLFHAAAEGDLRLFKGLAQVLDDGKGRVREAVDAMKGEGGVGALHVAAISGRLELCRYLVEDLRVDVDAADDLGFTPLIFAMNNENVAVFKYLLDHGADKDKVYSDGLAPLHCAAGLGNCEMIELLLAKGAYIDPVADRGTPLHIAALEGQAGAMKILLDHNADCNKTDIFGATPLLTAINAGSLKCVELLVEAGADVNADSIFTALIDATNEGSSECLNYLLETGANLNVLDDAKDVNTSKVAQLKSLGSMAVERKDYISASGFYSKAIDLDPHDATLLSNRSLCWLHMGDAQKALVDALGCREMRPDWPKACYRQGAALMLLKDFESACEAFFDGFKLDPQNAEIERALCNAMESLRTFHSNKVKLSMNLYLSLLVALAFVIFITLYS